MDINEKNVAITHQLCARDVAAAGLPATITVYEERRDALRDADYVFMVRIMLILRFITWDGADPKPTTVLSSQKVLLRTLRQNYFQVIMFDEPLKVDGPFYLGYSINYAAGDEFVVEWLQIEDMATTILYLYIKDEEWYSSPSAYQISTSTGIRPMTCLVGMKTKKLKLE